MFENRIKLKLIFHSWGRKKGISFIGRIQIGYFLLLIWNSIFIAAKTEKCNLLTRGISIRREAKDWKPRVINLTFHLATNKNVYGKVRKATFHGGTASKNGLFTASVPCKYNTVNARWVKQTLTRLCLGLQTRRVRDSLLWKQTCIFL